MQGEGALAGIATHFIRFGGCDFRCDFCDSMYAVEPAAVALAERLTITEIVDRVILLERGPNWVTLSGGNPALLKLGPLVNELHAEGWRVCVETQGSLWKDWLADVDCLTVSPKPPSSGMVSDRHTRQLEEFMRRAALAEKFVGGALKIVAFDDDDFEWAAEQFKRWPLWPAFISVGTDPVSEWGADWTKAVSTRQVRDTVGDRYAWLCDKVARRADLSDVRVLPQLHVIAFGHARGV